MSRDFDKNPYGLEEGRICDYIQKITKGQIGCGDDPIGFLIASHGSIGINAARQREALQAVLSWLDRKPTPEGAVYGHGTQEMRKLIEKALE